jgi:hypothetical protein
MKQLVTVMLLLALFCINTKRASAQENQHSMLKERWAVVDSMLERQANADSIISIIDTIGIEARRLKDIPSQIKAIYYKGILISNSKINGRYDAIAFIENQLVQSPKTGILKPLLCSVLADFYIKLEKDYSYKKNNRDSLTVDIKHWSEKQLNRRIQELLMQSLSSEETKQVDIRLFRNFFDGNAYAERPTLFDYLAYYAIDYFERQGSRVSIKSNPKIFSVDNLLSHGEPKDETQAIYYRLLKFHQKDGNSRAFVHAEVDRLKFIFSHLEWNEIGYDSLYLASLENFGKKYVNSAAYVEVVAALASYHYYDNFYYENITQLNRMERILRDVLKRRIKSPAYEVCQNIYKGLTASYLEIHVNKGNYPNSPILASITSRNTPKLSVYIDGNGYSERNSISLPMRGKSYYRIDTLALSKGLPEGEYTIKIHGGVDTDTLDFPIVITKILSFGVSINDSIFGVTVNRKSGNPISEVPVLVENRNNTGMDTLLHSDSRGFYYYKFPEESYASVDIKVDSIKTPYSLWYNEKCLCRDFIFTDRAIYRSGQTIHYKATVICQDMANNFTQPRGDISPYLTFSNGRRILDDTPTMLESLDGNSKIVYGKFTIPLDAALGEARIVIDGLQYNRQSIYIEEYKRPTFEVAVDSLLWDSSRECSYITGNARGYLGYPVDSAKVTLSISSPVDTTIVGRTDGLGNFKCYISNRKEYYQLNAAVTSQSGETQSEKFGGGIKEPFAISLYIRDTIDLIKPEELWISSNGYNTSGNIVISKNIKGKYITQATIPYNGKSYSSISIESGITSPGKYRVTYNAGGKVLATTYFIAVKTVDTRKFYLDKELYSIGDTAILTLLTTKSANTVVFIERRGKICDKFWIDSTKVEYKIPITRFESVGYRVITTLNGKTSEYSELANVDDDITKLNVELISFRNKLQPNSKETWTIKVTDYRGKPIVADITAAMYDASLDSYHKHMWLRNKLYFNNKLFSRYFSVDNKLEATTFSAWQGKTSIWYSSLLGWDFIPREASLDEVGRNRNEEVFFCVSEENYGDAPPPPGSVIYNRQENKLQKGIFPDIHARKNMGETMFFYPTIKTDSTGIASIPFVTNEALTRWRLMLFALSGNMQYGFSDSYHVSQKTLIVKPNPPRFLREGDQCWFTASIISMSDSAVSGSTAIEFFDLQTNEILNAEVLKDSLEKAFSVAPNGMSQVRWRVAIPEGTRNAIGYRVKAKSGLFSDGEENALPILSNRELMTESFAFNVAPQANETFTFKRFEQNSSLSLQNHKLSFEIIKNPIWEALTALPYLMTYPYGCSEQKMSKLYANLLALTILEKNPDVKATIESWIKSNSIASLNDDEKLKAVLAEETPWYSENVSESQRNAEVAKLFNVEVLNANISKFIAELKEQQLPDGSFPWMPGGSRSHYITQLVVEQCLHLQHIGVDLSKYKLNEVLNSAWSVCNAELMHSYSTLKKDVAEGKKRYEANHLSPLLIHQLYTNSLMGDRSNSDSVKAAYQYYLKQCITYYDKYSVACQGMIALSLYRSGDIQNANKILSILEEKAYKSDAEGMSWAYSPWDWYTLPIESQSVIIEAFHEIRNDKVIESQLKRWILKHKEANRWESTKATASAIYALLMIGEKVPVSYTPIDVKVGNDVVTPSNSKVESGYIRKQWTADEIDKSKATINITNPNSYPTWGSMSWQYFENIEKATVANHESLMLTKMLFKDVAGTLVPIDSTSTINVGDKIIVRLVIDAARDIEFVFLKDGRCPGLEPQNKLSGYKRGKSCFYYESIRDASTQYFFDELRQGRHIIDYTLFAEMSGSYNNGFATIECMYAPTVCSRTNGMHLNIGSQK